MQQFARGGVLSLWIVVGIATTTIAVQANTCDTGRYVYDPAVDSQGQAEPAIRVTHFRGRDALQEELDLIHAWPEIVGINPPTSVEIEREERLGIWPQHGWSQSSRIYRIQLGDVFILLLETMHYNSAYREIRPLIFVEMPERRLRPRQYDFAVVPLYRRDGNLFDTSGLPDSARWEGIGPTPDAIIMTNGFQVMGQELSKSAWHLPDERPYWESLMAVSGTWVAQRCDKTKDR